MQYHIAWIMQAPFMTAHQQTPPHQQKKATEAAW
jgi:hypothetical protein